MSDVDDTDTSEDDTNNENIKNSDVNFSSPDIWDNKVKLLDTSTSDIFDENDSSGDDLIPKSLTPEVMVSEFEDEDSIQSLKLDQNSTESISIKNMSSGLKDTDSTTSKSENTSAEISPPAGLLKVNSSSPEYLDLYSQDVFDVNSITVDKFYETQSTQDAENSFLSDLRMRPKTSYKLPDMSVFSVSEEVGQMLVTNTNRHPGINGSCLVKEDMKITKQQFPDPKKKSVLEDLENIFYMDGEGEFIVILL